MPGFQPSLGTEIPPPPRERDDFELSPEEKIEELESKKEDLEDAKQVAMDSIVIETRKKKKYQKEEDVQELKFDLPKNAHMRSIEFVKGEKNNFCFAYKDKQGNEIKASTGDLIADMQWGVYYDLNHEIKSQAHRREYNKFRKQYTEAVYQSQLEELETEQSLIQLLEIEHVEERDYYLGEAYKSVYEALKQHQAGKENMQAGFLLEKMINGLLTKISVDLGQKYGFSVEQATVIDDVELKIDLILKFADKNRGVGVEETTKSKGIQLTLIKKDDAKFKRKQEQVEKVKNLIFKSKKLPVDDLVLIQVGVNNGEISNAFEQWEESGKPVGGPEKLFTTRMIVNEFLKGIFQGTELDFDEDKDFKNELWEYFEGGE